MAAIAAARAGRGWRNVAVTLARGLPAALRASRQHGSPGVVAGPPSPAPEARLPQAHGRHAGCGA
jgi:hypothetical protein